MRPVGGRGLSVGWESKGLEWVIGEEESGVGGEVGEEGESRRERDVERGRCAGGPSRDGGGEFDAKVKSARISRSCRSVKFQKTTTP